MGSWNDYSGGNQAYHSLGAAYNEFLTPDVSTLICNDNSSMTEKLHYAINWKIPIVATDWLWDSIRSGVLKPYDPYLIRPPCNEQQSLACRVDENQSKNNEEGPSYANSLAHNGKAFKERSLVGLKLDISEGNFSNQYNDEPDSGMFGLDPLNMPSKGFVMPTNPTNMESTEVNGQPQMDHSSQTRNSTSIPLREISSNSSPKPSPSPSKPASPPPIKPIPRHGYEEDSLGPEISSLLAHHQRSSNAAQLPSSDVPKIGRRRRQLFGRAPSGISARSTGSVSISRASSVDTMNTDGLGTPLGSGNPNAKPESKAFALLRSYSEQEEKPEAVEEPMQMTQLGYEDPDIQAWRERVVRKLGGAKELEPDKVDTGRQLKGNKVVRDMVGRGTQGVAKRTRQALGR